MFQTSFNNMLREGGADTPVDVTVALTPNCCNAVGGGTTSLLASTIPRHSPDISLVGDYVMWEIPPLCVRPGAICCPAQVPCVRHGVLKPNGGVNQKITITGSGVDNPAPFIQNGAGKSEQLLINGSVGSSSADLEQFGLIVTSDATGKISLLIEPQGGTNVHLVGLAIQEFFDPVPGYTITETNGKTEVNETGAYRHVQHQIRCSAYDRCRVNHCQWQSKRSLRWSDDTNFHQCKLESATNDHGHGR